MKISLQFKPLSDYGPLSQVWIEILVRWVYLGIKGISYQVSDTSCEVISRIEFSRKWPKLYKYFYYLAQRERWWEEEIKLNWNHRNMGWRRLRLQGQLLCRLGIFPWKRDKFLLYLIEYFKKIKDDLFFDDSTLDVYMDSGMAK